MTQQPKTTHPIPDLIDAAGHLAVWVGFYAAAWMCACFWMFGLAIDGRAVAVAGLATIAVYLLDRIKLTDSAIDPADVEAHPRRLGFLSRHSRFARRLMLASVMGAAIVGWSMTPAIVLILLAACGGVWLYGSMPRRPRVKDRLVLKNATVAISMMVFFVSLVLFSMDGNSGRFWPITWPVGMTTVGLFVVLHIFADAMLCDLDDSAADEAFGTDTIVNRVGELRTWGIALLLASGAGAIAVIELLTREQSSVDLLTLTALAGGLAGAKALGSVVRLWLVPRGAWVRDAVDLHVPLVVLAVAALRVAF